MTIIKIFTDVRFKSSWSRFYHQDPRHKVWQLITFLRRVFIYFVVVILADNNRLFLPLWGRLIFKVILVSFLICTLLIYFFNWYYNFSNIFSNFGFKLKKIKQLYFEKNELNKEILNLKNFKKLENLKKVLPPTLTEPWYRKHLGWWRRIAVFVAIAIHCSWFNSYPSCCALGKSTSRHFFCLVEGESSAELQLYYFRNNL